MSPVAKTLKNEQIQYLTLFPPLCVERSMPLQKVFQKMKERKTGCALIVENQTLVGIFTERDALTRVAEKGIDLSQPIEKFMTPDPKSLKGTDSVAAAVRLMNQGGYRRIPLVDEARRVVGVISARNIVRYLAENFPYEVYNLPPDPHLINRAREGA